MIFLLFNVYTFYANLKIYPVYDYDVVIQDIYVPTFYALEERRLVGRIPAARASEQTQ